jgi:hypothetical protein
MSVRCAYPSLEELAPSLSSFGSDTLLSPASLYTKEEDGQKETGPGVNEAHHLLRQPCLCSITTTILGGSSLSKIQCIGLVGIPVESETR